MIEVSDKHSHEGPLATFLLKVVYLNYELKVSCMVYQKCIM